MNWIVRIKNLIKAAKLLSVDDSAGLRLGLVSALGKSQSAMIFSPYGLMHNPPPGSLVVLLSQQGQESNGIGLADDPKNRPLKNLKPGEVALGNYSTDNYIKFDENGLVTIIGETLNIQITGDATISAENITATATDSATVNANAATVNGVATVDINAPAITLAGTTIALNGTLTNNGVNIGSTHIHSQGNDSGGDAEIDTGVPHS